MAGFDDQPTSRRAIDSRATDPGAPLWPCREDPAGNRRALKLQEPSSEGLQGGASHRQGRPSEAGAWHGGDDRQGHKALPAQAGGGGYAACGGGKRGGGDLSGDSNPAIDAGVDQHRAYIERLQATFRARLAPLVRQTRAGAHKHCRLEAGMWLVGSCYNLLWAHRSVGEERTPAMAAGLTDHRWSMEELLTFAVPPAEVPRWRGRKPKWLLEAEDAA